MKPDPDFLLMKKLNSLLTDEEFFDCFSLSDLEYRIMQSDLKENEKLTSRLLILKKIHECGENINFPLEPAWDSLTLTEIFKELLETVSLRSTQQFQYLKNLISEIDDELNYADPELRHIINSSFYIDFKKTVLRFSNNETLLLTDSQKKILNSKHNPKLYPYLFEFYQKKYSISFHILSDGREMEEIKSTISRYHTDEFARIPFIGKTYGDNWDTHSFLIVYIKQGAHQCFYFQDTIFSAFSHEYADIIHPLCELMPVYSIGVKIQASDSGCYASSIFTGKEICKKNDGGYVLDNLYHFLKEHSQPIKENLFELKKLPHRLLLQTQISSSFDKLLPEQSTLLFKGENIASLRSRSYHFIENNEKSYNYFLNYRYLKELEIALIVKEYHRLTSQESMHSKPSLLTFYRFCKSKISNPITASMLEVSATIEEDLKHASEAFMQRNKY